MGLGMSFRPNHEIHARRFGRNLGIGLILAALVALIFGMTVVKLTEGDVPSAIAGRKSSE